MRFHLSNEFFCIKSATKQHEKHDADSSYWISLTSKLDKDAFKFLKVRSDNF